MSGVGDNLSSLWHIFIHPSSSPSLQPLKDVTELLDTFQRRDTRWWWWWGGGYYQLEMPGDKNGPILRHLSGDDCSAHGASIRTSFSGGVIPNCLRGGGEVLLIHWDPRAFGSRPRSCYRLRFRDFSSISRSAEDDAESC